jgi:hypothetical protein
MSKPHSHVRKPHSPNLPLQSPIPRTLA